MATAGMAEHRTAVLTLLLRRPRMVGSVREIALLDVMRHPFRQLGAGGGEDDEEEPHQDAREHGVRDVTEPAAQKSTLAPRGASKGIDGWTRIG